MIAVFAAVVYRMVFMKNYVEYDKYYKVNSGKTDFRPGAYCFYHVESYDSTKPHQPAISYLYSYNQRYHRYDTSALDSIDFDFTRYSYLVVYGAKVKNMYWNFITTTFEDDSPSYCCARRYGQQFVKIEYEEPDGNIYIYRIKHNEALTGYCGL